MDRFGFTASEWSTLKEEVFEILKGIAAQRRMITYGEIASEIRGAKFDAYDKRLWDLIGDVGIDEVEAGRGLLCVLVVHKHGDMEPGNGFFELAARYGRSLRDQTKCFIEEVKRVHYEWSVKQK
jgi:hypothetical protein